MCECLRRDDGTWHVDECCAEVMDEYHAGRTFHVKRPTWTDRSWWSPKTGPRFSDGRRAHFCFAWAVTTTAALFGYGALGMSLMLTAAFWLWEALTPVAPWKGSHPFGDVLDFAAFEAGQLAGIVLSVFAIGHVRS